MALSPGTRLGPFEILAQIGVGGMGEVYRATDTNLKRAVAVKVLPAQLTGDAERLSRLQREAEVLASLNHPNIAQVYGLERSDGITALVMELVEGPTLAERIANAVIPLDEALPIARQIADALETAHDRGIIHRDLKPANIKVRLDGTVKVLDFGLAKAMDPLGASSTHVTASPTITSPALMTGIGTLLGTAAYMSPEQARGKAVDKRADIWAFGVVLYEMLTGERPFTGDDLTDTLAAVVKENPDLSRTPIEVQRLLKGCLEKDPRNRLRDIGDVWRLMEEPAVAPAPFRSRIGAAGWLVAAVLAVVLGVALWTPWQTAPPSADPKLYEIPLPAGKAPTGGFAVSPNGRWLAFTTVEPNSQTARLWVRPLDSFNVREVSGFALFNFRGIFWSHDSRFVAAVADGKLKKADVVSGETQTVCDLLANPAGGSWNADGVMLVGLFGEHNRVMQVSPNCTLSPAAPPLQAGLAPNFNTITSRPQFLPDGRHFLYAQSDSLFVSSLDSAADGPSPKPLVTGLAVTDPVIYVPSANDGPGHLLFVRRDNTLMAQRFDDRRRTLAGDAVAVVQNVESFSASSNGVLVYRTRGYQELRQLTWIDRHGMSLDTVGEPGAYQGPALSPASSIAVSPDATRAATVIEGNLWLVDLVRGSRTPFTFFRSVLNPVWSADGNNIAFMTAGGPTPGRTLYLKRVGATTDPESLLASLEFKVFTDWSRDGRYLLYDQGGISPLDRDVWVLPLDTRKPTRLLGTKGMERGAQFSPDGKLIAYSSDESGAVEVWARPFVEKSASGSPGVGSRTLVSRSKGGGSEPRWRDKELFYLSSDGTLMSVEQTGDPVFPFSNPKPLLREPLVGNPWDITRDGKRILVAVPVTQSAPPPFTVLLNWQGTLKQ